MTSGLRIPAAIVCAALVCAGSVPAQDSGVEARGRSAVERMHTAYKSLHALHIKVTWTARYRGDATPEDFPLPGPEALELRMQRPNKFYMQATATSDDGKPTRYLIVSDGTNLWHWRSPTNTYIQLPAPATLADMARLLPDDAVGTYDGVTWSIDDIAEWDLLVNDIDPMAGLAGSGMVVALGAPQKIGHTAVDVVQFTLPASPVLPLAIEETYYLSASSHLIQGCLLTARGKHPETGKDMSVTMRAAYDVLETQPRFTDADFAFTPPQGATKKADATRTIR